MHPTHDNQQLLCRMAIGMIPHINLGIVRRLMERLGSPQDFFDCTSSQLYNILGNKHNICDEDYRRVLLETAAGELKFVTDNNIKVYFCTDEDYPIRLRDCDDAPACMYMLGNCDLNSRHIISVVGTRNATTYGIETTRRLLHDLAENIPDVMIVSGLAYGIDVTAHRTALTEGLSTVGVVAHGLDTIYPADHRDVAARMVRSGGGMLSEYPSHTRIHRSNFLARNRIVASLCDALIVVESDCKGGALSTARFASLYGRSVFAVPGRIGDTYSRGTNKLIDNDTARILLDADSLIDSLGWTPVRSNTAQEPAALFKPIPPEQQTILDFITDHPSATVNDMCATLGMPFAQVHETLFQMEMSDLIVSVPGGRYTKI